MTSSSSSPSLLVVARCLLASTAVAAFRTPLTTTTMTMTTTTNEAIAPRTRDTVVVDDGPSMGVVVVDRRRWLSRTVVGVGGSLATAFGVSSPAFASGDDDATEVLVGLTGDAKKLFNEGRVYEMQGNVAAANRIYAKITKLVPQFIYGWSNLGNTEVVLGNLAGAERSYSTSINLCQKQREEVGDTFGVRRCDDLYVLFLNRGCLRLRLDTGMRKEALEDLELAASLRGKPDAVVLQNRAQAREFNGLYGPANRDYDTAIAMTSNEVAPFWLRAAMVKFQLGDTIGAMDLLRRVENKFPEAPEVRAALATMLERKGDDEGARKKFLEIPDRPRAEFGRTEYLMETVSWPPAMREWLGTVRKAVGDDARGEEV